MGKIIYTDKDGVKLPGVTTITGELGWNKQVLISWANKLGLKGIEAGKYVDDKAQIGTLAHQMVLDHLRQAKTDTADYSANQISQAENCILSYYAWEKGKVIEPILLETPLISEVHKFGGTMDCFAKIDGVITLNDYKTGKGIYDEYFIQVAGGYLILLEENGHRVEAIQILNIPRSEDEAFQVKPLNREKWELCKKIFLNCLDNYKLKRQLTKED
jgi:hypothetical protein